MFGLDILGKHMQEEHKDSKWFGDSYTTDSSGSIYLPKMSDLWKGFGWGRRFLKSRR